MERLTVKGPSGLISLKDKSENGANQAIKCLSEYEDTGLTPEQIMKLKERDTAKEIQKVEEQPYFRKHFHSYICPVCHKKVESGWSFCGHCGQKLKRKD